MRNVVMKQIINCSIDVKEQINNIWILLMLDNITEQLIHWLT